MEEFLVTNKFRCKDMIWFHVVRLSSEDWVLSYRDCHVNVATNFFAGKMIFLTDAWQDVACHRKQNAKLKKHVWVQKKVHFISSCSKVLHPKKVNSNEAGTEIPIVAFDISFDINFSWSMSGTALCFAAQNLFKEGKCGWKKLTIAEETLCSVYSLRKFWHGLSALLIPLHFGVFVQ